MTTKSEATEAQRASVTQMLDLTLLLTSMHHAACKPEDSREMRQFQAMAAALALKAARQ